MTEQEERIWAQIQLEKRKSTREKAFRVLADCLLLFTVGSFLFSPCFQLILRVISRRDAEWYNIQRTISIYQDMVQKVNILALFTAVLCYGYYAVQLFRKRKMFLNSLKSNFRRLVPLFLLWLLALIVPLVTIIRGPNEYDLSGHPYMFESIFSYMLYPTCYFFCGAMLWKSGYKRGLLYLLLFSALPINVLALINEWGVSVPFFLGAGVSAVFHNSNHYGYYLAMTIIASLALFVYEKRGAWKVVSAMSAEIGTLVLIMNNTLGAYLAVLLVMLAFAVYCFLCDKGHLGWSLGALGIFLLVTLCMSSSYNTILSSFITLFHDVGEIAEDPFEADSAGSSRWLLWKGTVSHLDESPLLGFGVEGLLNTHHIGTPHNELLQYAAFFGFPAAVSYLAAVVSVIIAVLRDSKKLGKMTLVCFCVAVGYFTSSMFGVAVYYTTPFFYIFLGLAYSEILNGKNTEKTEEE
ncbi:MAG: O-antigen ligase family protein [Ruminococcus sp.]|nr:O-antigen ligase family protein [Ruminococcus sp.]